jgi:hypothetical protein
MKRSIPRVLLLLCVLLATVKAYEMLSIKPAQAYSKDHEIRQLQALERIAAALEKRNERCR